MRHWLLLCFLLFWSSAAMAHMLPKQNATINVKEKSAFCVVSVPASALKGVDDDGDGLISNIEIQKHTAAIQQQFDAGFHLSSDVGNGKQIFSWVMPPQTDDTLVSDYVVILHRSDFAEPPKSVSVDLDLFGTKVGEGQMTVKATLNTISEVAILKPDGATHQFFRGKLTIFGDFVRVGIDHILTGYDHLLFLLTIVVAAAGWRYWLGVVTSFTVAHSITLTLSTLDIMRIPANIVEPGIAASIVLMALLNLYRPAAVMDKRRMWTRVALVFACGLLHGFGFASAIGAIAVDSGSQFATLAGFNIGIEIGQFLFLATIMLLTWAVGKIWRPQFAARIPQLASAVAAVFGIFFLAQQTGLV